MDFTLRCNDLKCRTRLDDRAVVTTCSHVFCLPCSENLGLANPDINARVCPACQAHLANPDDAVVTQLNPTEDYKTSVLSGLSPTIVMECAGRALSFFSYQTTQEILYQEVLARSLTDKYTNLSSQMDKVIHDANIEIMNLRDKIQAMHLEQKALEKTNQDLHNAFKEKQQSHKQLAKDFRSLKQKQGAPGVALGAEHNAGHLLHAAAADQYEHGGQRNGQYMHSRGSNGSGGSGNRSRTIHNWEQSAASRGELNSAHSAPTGGIPATPTGNRHRQPLYANSGTATKHGFVDDGMRQGTPYRQTLGSLDPNIYRTNAGYSISGGMKVGRPPNGPIGRAGMAQGISAGVGMGRMSFGGLGAR